MKSIRLAVLLILAGFASLFGVVQPHQTARAAPPNLTVTKVCLTTTISINGTTQCTITITATAAASFTEPVVVNLVSNVNVAGTEDDYGQVRLLNGVTGSTGPDVDTVVVVNPSGGAQSIIVSCTGATCDFAAGDTITIVEGIQGAVGGVVNETITFGAGPVEALAPSITVLPATVTISAVCTPLAINAGSGTPGDSDCVLTFADNDIFPTQVSSANVSIQLTGPAGAVFTGTGTKNTAVHCGGAGEAQSCTNIPVSVQSTSVTDLGNVGFQVTYTPDIAAVDNPNVVNVNNAVAIVTPATNPPQTPASVAVASAVTTIPCGTAGNITATLRDAGNNLVLTPTSVAFTTTLGSIGTPVTSSNGVATTALVAPATGSGGTAIVTATAGGISGQTTVTLGACAATAPAGASTVTLGSSGSVACGGAGTITATLRDAGGALVTTATPVTFGTTLGNIGTPVNTANGVATTSITAPASGSGGTAVVTATAGSATGQTTVTFGSCATTTTTTTSTAPTTPFYPYVYPPVMPTYTQPYVAAPVAQPPPQVTVNAPVTINIPPEALRQGPPAQQPAGAQPVAAGPMILRPPNTGDGGLVPLLNEELSD